LQINTWYRLSLYCGLIPLSLGVLIFYSWYLTGASWLEAAGLLNIVVGLWLFSAGLLCLGIYIYKSYKENISGSLKKVLLSLFILFINFPVAVAAIYFAEEKKSICTISVKNNSNMQITEFQINERENVYKLEDVPPGGELNKEFVFKYEGSVSYSFRLGGKHHQGLVFGYVASGLSSTSTLVVSESNEVSVEEVINGK